MTNPIQAPPLSCEDYYKQLQVSCHEVIAASFHADTAGLQARSHSFVGDLEQWLNALAHRPESELIKAGLREYQFALLAVVQGQYRQAFMALRLSFELVIGAVYLSANELELRVWLRGQRDLIWSALIDPDSGVFSSRFVGAFYEQLADEAPHYCAIARAVYRECSEYVHGNAPTHSHLPDGVEFRQEVFQEWHAEAKNVRLATSFALCGRYVGLADTATRVALEPVLLDNLGHIAAVRVALGAPVEPQDV